MPDQQRQFAITRDGKPCATIVIPRAAEPRLLDAVADFVHVIERMAGPTAPVLTDGIHTGNGAEIHIGLTDFVKQERLLPESLPVNGYRIAVCEENGQPRLVIAGPTTLGTTHGVAGFLTDDLGVLWGMCSRDSPSFTLTRSENRASGSGSAVVTCRQLKNSMR